MSDMSDELLQEEDRLLIVDDDEAILRLLRDFLSEIGLPCSLARDGLQAIVSMERVPAAVIVTDLLMPNMNGLELTSKVKARWPDTDIIVMTGFTKDFRYTDVIKAGASDFIQKPFSLDEFEAKLLRLMKERALRHKLEQLSLRDTLTDLYNRRFFDQRLEEEAERAARQGYGLYLAIVDIDNFKALNDQKGHEFGDKVLISLGEVLKSSIRNSVDTPCRIGGDEFAVILPQVGAKEAEMIAERIRRNYLNYKDRGETTLSVGVAGFKKTSQRLRDDVTSLIHEADEAMYVAKKTGGDKVVAKDVTGGSNSKRSKAETVAIASKISLPPPISYDIGVAVAILSFIYSSSIFL
ncbi:MAG: GGDEF domain-containing response regulator [Dissulfurimicrobium hydrothermale]|uniref:GGDEF domain-containing response regulator n=1 Tax=Dissulfurimicrobium hydrothermale TaxID=1750598 RepID=UPI003C76E5F1